MAVEQIPEESKRRIAPLSCLQLPPPASDQASNGVVSCLEHSSLALTCQRNVAVAPGGLQAREVRSILLYRISVNVVQKH